MNRISKLMVSLLSVSVVATVAIGVATHRSATASMTDILSGDSSNNANVSAQWSTLADANGSMDGSLVSTSNHQTYYTNKVVIVTFHDVDQNMYSPWVITPSTFDADLDAIGKKFHVISNRQFINFLNHRGMVPPNAVLLTFDDGYRDMYTYVLPDLLQHHMTGTFFDIVNKADNQVSNYLTWDEMKEMVSDGMTVASHTYHSHFEVPYGPHGMMVPVFDTRTIIKGKRESIMHYHERIYADFLRARLELQRELGVHDVNQFAWPFGWGIPMAIYAAHQAGYKYLYTTTDGFVSTYTNRTDIPRIDIGKRGITPGQAVQQIIDTAHPNGKPAPNHGARI